MWRAIEEVKDQLIWFGKSTHHYTFAEKMFNTINQLSSSLIDFDNLESKAKTEITKKKMHDISIINKKYRKLTAEYTDSSGMLSYLIENIKLSQSIKQSSIFVCGFEHLSIQRIAVLNELLKHASKITIGIKEGSEFEGQIAQILFDVANVGVIVSTGKSLVTSAEILLNIYNNKQSSVKLKNVTCSQNKTPQSEATNIANQVRGLLNDGINPSDIKVLLCDYENTYQMFEHIFNQNNIDVNLDVGIPLTKTSLAIFVTDILSLANHDNAENFIPILKSKFLNLDTTDVFVMENICLKRNFGLSNFIKHHDKEINDKTLSTLNQFSGYYCNLIKSKTVHEICQSLLNIIVAIGESKLDPIEQISSTKIEGLLKILAEHVGDRKMTFFEFVNIFSIIANSIKVSTIPTFANRVMLINMAEYQSSQTPYIFVTNIHDGVFPISRPDTDILTELDIKSMTVTIEPTATIQNARNRNHCLEILSSYTRALHLSSIVTNSSNEEVGTSEIIERIKTIDPTIEQSNQNINSRYYAMGEVLTAIGNETAFADMEYWNSILASLELENFEIPKFEHDEKNIKCGEKLFLNKGSLSVTTLESFFSCPYYNFLTRGIRLNKRQLYNVGSDVLGNLIHKIVEEYTKLIIKNPKTKIPEKEVTKIINDTFKSQHFAYFTAREENRPLVESLKKELRVIIEQINSHLETTEFKPKYVEKSLSHKVNDVKIIGKADRIDTKDKDVFIIDYKTGSNVEFRLRGLYQGIKLQLPLYLMMLKNDGYNPSGAAYFHLKSGLSKEAKLKGMLDYSEDEIKNVLDYANHMATQGINYMQNGVIKKSASSDKICKYCPANALCFAKENPRVNDITQMKPKDFGVFGGGATW